MPGDLLAGLNVVDAAFHLKDNRRMSQARSGLINPGAYGARPWVGTYTLQDMDFATGRRAMHLLHGAQEAGYTFRAYSFRCEYLQNDPGGLLAASWLARFELETVTQGDTVRVLGVPEAFEFLPGDRLSYSFGVAPERFFLHEVYEVGGYDNVAGSRTLRVRGFVPAGIPADTQITFSRAACEAIVVPGSVQMPRENLDRWTGGKFDFVQAIQ